MRNALLGLTISIAVAACLATPVYALLDHALTQVTLAITKVDRNLP